MAKEKAWHKFLPDASLDLSEENLEEFFALMFERQEIWYKRNILKQPAPWTENKILREYKFTNVYRELDRSSQWLIKNIIQDETLDLPDLIFRMMIYKFYNLPDTFEGKGAIILPQYKSFNAKSLWKQTYIYREKYGNPWHQAFLMNPTNLVTPEGWNGRGIWKDEVYCTVVFKKVYELIPALVNCFDMRRRVTADVIIECLKSLPAVSDFMATEFYLDFTYINKYSNKHSFPYDEIHHINCGPGAAVGLRLIFPNLSIKRREYGIQLLLGVAEEQLKKIGKFEYVKWDKKQNKYVSTKFNLTWHQIQFTLCEYQKYFKMRIGEGKQRTKFIPKTIIS